MPSWSHSNSVIKKEITFALLAEVVGVRHNPPYYLQRGERDNVSCGPAPKEAGNGLKAPLRDSLVCDN